MPSKEFEISLTRELNVCKNTIQRIQKTLGILERKHNKTTDIFIQELLSSALTGHPEYKKDYEAWQISYESLRKWEELEGQYQEVLRMMKL